jgi:hypothetical protein
MDLFSLVYIIGHCKMGAMLMESSPDSASESGYRAFKVLVVVQVRIENQAAHDGIARGVPEGT